jgi:pimeloyl-ACP methyl ester carboxylesterase
MGLLYDEEKRHAELGPVEELQSGYAIRRHSGDLNPDPPVLSGRVVSDPYGTPAKAGLDVVEQTLGTPPAPAWELRDAASRNRDWAVHVHGALSGRESMLRTAKSFADLGFTSLVVTYRGDDEHPHPQRRSTLGQTEWQDIEAAIQHAVDSGAERIVLVGLSFGATIALSFKARSSIAKHVDGLLLVAPVVDWAQSIRANVRAARLPAFVAAVSCRLLTTPLTCRWLGLSEPIAFDRLNFVSQGVGGVPTLVLHCRNDPVAPFSSSEQLTNAFPDDVTLVSFPGSSHALEWNTDRHRFDSAIASWIEQRLSHEHP